MAFSRRFSNLWKGSISHNVLTSSIVPMMSMLNSIHYVPCQIFVGDLSTGVKDHLLETSFAKCGEIVDAKVKLNRKNGKSRGFGYVTFATKEQANAAISSMNGQKILGRRVRLAIARKPVKRIIDTGPLNENEAWLWRKL